MKPLAAISPQALEGLEGVFTDIDDTLTSDGRLSAAAYGALERLQDKGLLVIPVTGRPAGWCDHIARMWPVDGVVGENGAFYFRYHRESRSVERFFCHSAAERAERRGRLEALGKAILEAVPGAALAADQAWRESDLAIDFCEDVAPLPPESVQRIVELFTAAGATAKVSSIHVNGWFGSYDKLSTSRTMMAQSFGLDLDERRERFVFAGDSPNDAPMFAFFPLSVGMANLLDFSGRLEAEPAFITVRRAGQGFVELVDRLIAER